MPVYKQYYVLQKYKGNAPISPAEFKKGELYKIDNFDDASECVGQAPVETLYEWRKTDEYICDGTTSYYLEQQYYSVDSGVNWYPVYPIEYQWSTLRKENDEDCGGENPKDTVYRWVVTNGYVCDGTSKYTKEKRQYSTDGINWFDVSPEEIQKGTLIGYESVDCGYVAPITQWVGTEKTVCQGYDKYVIQKEQISYDGGVTWTDTGVEKIGNVIQSNSYDCDYGVSWVEVENEYICSESKLWRYPKNVEGFPYNPEENSPGFTFLYDHDDDYYRYYRIEGAGSKINLRFADEGGYLDLSGIPTTAYVDIGFYVHCLDFDGYNMKTLDASHWNVEKTTNMHFMFGTLGTVEEINVSFWNTSNVTNMSNLFAGVKGPDTIVGLDTWDTSKVTTMLGMFSGCSTLTTLDVSHFDMSNVTNIKGIFSGCVKLPEIIGVEDWDTSNVTDMDSVFAGCKSLSPFPNLTRWNTSKVTTMAWMFENCTTIENINLSSWDTSSLYQNTEYEGLYGMFEGCTSVKTINLSGWNTSDLTNIHTMFHNCTSLETLDISGWDLTLAYDLVDWDDLRDPSFHNPFKGTGTGNPHYPSTIYMRGCNDKTVKFIEAFVDENTIIIK